MPVPHSTTRAGSLSTVGGASLLAAVTLSACDEEEEERAIETVRPVRAVQIADASSFTHRWFSGRAKATPSAIDAACPIEPTTRRS